MNKFNIGDIVKVIDTPIFHYKHYIDRIGKIFKIELPIIETGHKAANDIIYGVMFKVDDERSMGYFKAKELKKVEDLEIE